MVDLRERTNLCAITAVIADLNAVSRHMETTFDQLQEDTDKILQRVRALSSCVRNLRPYIPHITRRWAATMEPLTLFDRLPHPIPPAWPPNRRAKERRARAKERNAIQRQRWPSPNCSNLFSPASLPPAMAARRAACEPLPQLDAVSKWASPIAQEGHLELTTWPNGIPGPAAVYYQPPIWVELCNLEMRWRVRRRADLRSYKVKQLREIAVRVGVSDAELETTLAMPHFRGPLIELIIRREHIPELRHPPPRRVLNCSRETDLEVPQAPLLVRVDLPAGEPYKGVHLYSNLECFVEMFIQQIHDEGNAALAAKAARRRERQRRKKRMLVKLRMMMALGKGSLARQVEEVLLADETREKIRATRAIRLVSSNAQALLGRLSGWKDGQSTNASNPSGSECVSQTQFQNGNAEDYHNRCGDAEYSVCMPSNVLEHGLLLVPRQGPDYQYGVLSDFTSVVNAAARQSAHTAGSLGDTRAWTAGRWRLLVCGVTPRSAATRAGIVVGDELLGVDILTKQAIKYGYSGNCKFSLDVQHELRQVHMSGAGQIAGLRAAQDVLLKLETAWAELQNAGKQYTNLLRWRFAHREAMVALLSEHFHIGMAFQTAIGAGTARLATGIPNPGSAQPLIAKRWDGDSHGTPAWTRLIRAQDEREYEQQAAIVGKSASYYLHRAGPWSASVICRLSSTAVAYGAPPITLGYDTRHGFGSAPDGGGCLSDYPELPRVTVLQDWGTTEAGYLELVRGEVLCVVEAPDEEEWWRGYKLDTVLAERQVADFPRSLVTPINIMRSNHVDQPRIVDMTGRLVNPIMTPEGHHLRVRVLQRWRTTENGYLRLRKGAVIVVTAQSEQDWWTGYLEKDAKIDGTRSNLQVHVADFPSTLVVAIDSADCDEENCSRQNLCDDSIISCGNSSHELSVFEPKPDMAAQLKSNNTLCDEAATIEQLYQNGELTAEERDTMMSTLPIAEKESTIASSDNALQSTKFDKESAEILLQVDENVGAELQVDEMASVDKNHEYYVPQSVAPTKSQPLSDSDLDDTSAAKPVYTDEDCQATVDNAKVAPAAKTNAPPPPPGPPPDLASLEDKHLADFSKSKPIATKTSAAVKNTRSPPTPPGPPPDLATLEDKQAKSLPAMKKNTNAQQKDTDSGLASKDGYTETDDTSEYGPPWNKQPPPGIAGDLFQEIAWKKRQRQAKAEWMEAQIQSSQRSADAGGSKQARVTPVDIWSDEYMLSKSKAKPKKRAPVPSTSAATTDMASLMAHRRGMAGNSDDSDQSEESD